MSQELGPLHEASLSGSAATVVPCVLCLPKFRSGDQERKEAPVQSQRQPACLSATEAEEENAGSGSRGHMASRVPHWVRSAWPL